MCINGWMRPFKRAIFRSLCDGEAVSQHKRIPALILRSTKYGEADLILQCLTADEGKLSLLARGALRSKKRFGGGVLEPTHHVEIQYTSPRQAEGLAILQEATLVNGFQGLRERYERLEMGLQVVQAALKVSQEGEVHQQSLYHLTGHALAGLEACDDVSQFKIHFSLRFLLQQGVLQQEPWMEIYLKTPMASTQKLQGQQWQKASLLWIETALNQYLMRAES
jgi:DNA repair protein RecO (recombination protein O)